MAPRGAATAWSRCAPWPSLLETTSIAISDFALLRQARWREAIASIFDDPDFMPYLRSLRRVAVTYGTHDETGATGTANLVKPVYHIGWLASRLDLHVRKPLAEVAGHGPASSGSGRAVRGGPAAKPVLGRGLVAMLSDGRADVSVVMRPVVSKMPSGTTLRVELLAERRGSELRADVTAEAETVHVRVWLDGVEALDRHFLSPRSSEEDLLGQAIEASGRDPVESGALRAAAALIAPPGAHAMSGRPVADGVGPEIVVVADPVAATGEAARRIAEALAAADAERGRADWATTGGSTVAGIYRALTETALMELVPWPRLHVWWGDERYVPRDHPLSNAKPFDDIVAGIALGEEGTAGGGWPGEPLPFDHIHPFRAGEAIAAGRGPEWAASAMADELRADGPTANGEGWPVFDVLLLGVGRDGHVLSVFPGSPALGCRGPRARRSRHRPTSSHTSSG